MAERSVPQLYSRVLLLSVFIIAACGILYELLISTIATYFLGSSVLYFSLTIGLFLFFMGVGSYLSKFIHDRLLERFIVIEIIIGYIGSISAMLLYFGFTVTGTPHLILLGVIAAISTLVGLEIPLVIRIVEKHETLKEAVANILAFDYVGALIASLIFPLVLLPFFGLMRVGFVIGAVNLAIALVNVVVLRRMIQYKPYLIAVCCGFILTGAGFLESTRIVSFFENYTYQDEIIFAEQTPYQRIVVTTHKEDTRLYLNSILQFSSVDEYRYHESLVHVPMSIAKHRSAVLVLGGGDGLAAREIVKYADVESITVVDIDAAMTELARTHPVFRALNADALADRRVTVVNQDAYTFVRDSEKRYDVVIIDLPDPNDHAIGRLYTREFYRTLSERLTAEGIVVTQATSPYFARRAFWTIAHTVGDVYSWVQPYTVYVPSFGQWGFVLAGENLRDMSEMQPRVNTKFLTADVMRSLFRFDPDTAVVGTDINTLDNQVLVTEYEKSWEALN